jgi:glycosyltransferase involved in cell wall biosynthesis
MINEPRLSASSQSEIIESDSPRVSVVIPAYQCAQYIAQAVQSVLEQSFQEIEVIVVNDGSPDTDALEEALRPYQEYIRYIKQQTGGPAAARNRGILQSAGEFIAFLDSDDYWSPTHLAKQLALLEGQPELGLVYCDCFLVKNDKPFTRAFINQPQADHATFESLLVESSAISTSSVVVSREAIISAGLFDIDFIRCEDFDMWLRMSFAGVGIAFHPGTEVYHRVNAAGLSANRQAMTHDLIRVYQKVSSQLPISPEQRRIVQIMVARAEAESLVEKLKESLEDENYAEAIRAADRAYEVKKSWKLRISLLALRLAPRLFRALHLGRLYIFRRRRYSVQAHPADSSIPAKDGSIEERQPEMADK